jgi:hypothetical protein
VALKAALHSVEDGVGLSHRSQELRFRGGWNDEPVDPEDSRFIAVTSHLYLSLFGRLRLDSWLRRFRLDPLLLHTAKLTT